MSLLSSLPLMKKCLLLICLVRFELENFLFISSLEVAWSSGYIIFWSTDYHWTSMKYWLHNSYRRMTSAPTSLVSIELLFLACASTRTISKRHYCSGVAFSIHVGVIGCIHKSVDSQHEMYCHLELHVLSAIQVRNDPLNFLDHHYMVSALVLLEMRPFFL